MFSFVPRYQGEGGSQRPHLDAGRDHEVRVRCHLLAMIPRQRPAEVSGELEDH